MRKLLIFLSCLFIAGSFGANSRESEKMVKADKSVVCFPLESLIKNLNDFGEEMMVAGKTSGMDGVLTATFVNPRTGTYTVVEMDEEAGCIISIGTQVRYRFPKLGTSM